MVQPRCWEILNSTSKDGWGCERGGTYSRFGSWCHCGFDSWRRHKALAGKNPMK